MLSNQFPFTQRSKLSMPMNQSGDGIIRDMSETCKEKKKHIDLINSKV